jgi:hypothetical protein
MIEASPLRRNLLKRNERPAISSDSTKADGDQLQVPHLNSGKPKRGYPVVESKLLSACSYSSSVHTISRVP